MSRRGSLFYYGPGQQRLLVDGINRDFPCFRTAGYARAWAAKKGIEFVDATDPANYRLPGRLPKPCPACVSPTVSETRLAGSENAASAASRFT